MSMIRSVEQVYHQNFINLHMCKSLLEHDGAHLKKILVLDKDGFCSSDIALAEVALKESKIDFLGMKCSQETEDIAKLIMCRSDDRKVLLQSLIRKKFDEVHKIFEKNPYVLYTYRDDSMFNTLNSAFIKKFIDSLSLSGSYEHDIKPLLHHGFNFEVRDKSGIPLLCTVIVSKSGDKYLDLLKAGVWVNIQDGQGNTPLCYAAELGDREKIDTLLLYGAAVNKSINTKIGVNHPMRPLMVQLFRSQRCCACASHEDYLSNIPCIMRHLQPEVKFICKHCYDQMDEKKCPVCARLLGKFGT